MESATMMLWSALGNPLIVCMFISICAQWAAHEAYEKALQRLQLRLRGTLTINHHTDACVSDANLWHFIVFACPSLQWILFATCAVREVYSRETAQQLGFWGNAVTIACAIGASILVLCVLHFYRATHIMGNAMAAIIKRSSKLQNFYRFSRVDRENAWYDSIVEDGMREIPMPARSNEEGVEADTEIAMRAWGLSEATVRSIARAAGGVFPHAIFVKKLMAGTEPRTAAQASELRTHIARSLAARDPKRQV